MASKARILPLDYTSVATSRLELDRFAVMGRAVSLDRCGMQGSVLHRS